MESTVMTQGSDVSAAPSKGTGWGPVYYLALASVPLLAYQFWTLLTWLADGPFPVNQYRETGSTSWYAARIIEVLLILVALVMIAGIVRDCRRQRRLTFDAMLLIGLTATIFWDTFVTFIEPIWFYSSNWVNLNDWWGHAPLIQNTTAGTTPFPVLFLGFLYPVGCLGAAMLVTLPMHWAQRRWPDISNGKLVGVAFLSAIPVWFCIDGILVITHLWGGPGMWLALPLISNLLGEGYHWSVMELGYCICWGTFLGCLRFFKDDQGRGLTERGIQGLGPRLRTAISVLATITVLNLAVIVLEMPVLFTGFFSSHAYPHYPHHLVNGVCDAPGWTDTPYGPCPGSKGFRVPLKSTQ